LPQTLLVLSYIATTQADALVRLPPLAFDHLSRLPNLASEVSKLTGRKKKAARFGFLLVRAAVEQGIDADDCRNFDALVKATTLGGFSSKLSHVFLEMAKSPLKGAKKARLVEMIKLFDVFHGEAMDKAVNGFLAGGSSGTDASRKNVLAILESSLEDTVRAPLVDANVTLSAGIDHAQASIRMMALERLDEICSQEDSKLKEEAEVTLKGALSRRLEDDDMGVVLTALRLRSLTDMLPEAALIGALVQSVDRCMDAVYEKGSGKRTRGLGRKAAKAALRRLGDLAAAKAEATDAVGGAAGAARAAKKKHVKHQSDGFDVTVAAALLSVIFAGQGSYTVSVEALRILAEGEGPLAGALKDCVSKHADAVANANANANQPGQAKTPKAKAAKTPKTSKGAKRARDEDAGAPTTSSAAYNFDVCGYNRDVIAHLAKAALSDESAYRLLRSVLGSDASPSCSPQAKAAVLCVFEQSILMSAADKKAASKRNKIASDVVQWFHASREQPGMAVRKSHQGLRALWDARAKCISDQTLVDLASRACSVFSVEPEAVFMCLEAVSTSSFGSAGCPSPTELYAYLAQLQTDVYSQHLDVLLKKVQDPLDMLASVWTGASQAADGAADSAAAAAALRQWSAYIASPQGKLKDTEKQRVVKSVMGLVCAMMHPSRNVRRAALEASERLGGSIGGWWPAKTTEKWTKRDTIESLLELCVKNDARILGDSDGVEYLLQQVAETTSHGKQRKKGKSPRASDSKIHPVFFDADALCSFLMQELCDSSATSPVAVPILVRSLEFSSESGKLCGVASELLDKMFYDIETEAFTSSLDPEEKAAAVELVNVLNDPVLQQNQSSQKRESVLRASLLSARWESHPDLREVALKALGHSSRGQVADQDMQSICRVLMAAASSESSAACRNAAIETLERVDIKPDVVIPFLHVAQTAPSSSKRKKGGRTPAGGVSPATSAPGGAHANVSPPDMSLCLHTLELMQWKKDMQGMDRFVVPLQELVGQFLARSLAVRAADNEDNDDNDGGKESQGAAVSGYGLQLCLNVLLSISEDVSLESKTRALFDTKAIVGCASSATDHAARTVALELLRSRIESNPDGAMDQILQTVQTICAVVSNEHDKYSTGLAAKAMSTAAAAWIGRGNSIHDLVSNVIEAINDSSTSRKYAILGAIVDSMPSNAAETMASISFHLVLSSSGDGDGKDEVWRRDAAFSMLSKVRLYAHRLRLADGTADRSISKARKIPSFLHVSLIRLMRTKHHVQLLSEPCVVVRSAAAAEPQPRSLVATTHQRPQRKKAVCVSALGGMLQLCIACSKKSKFEILRQANAIAIRVLTSHAAALRRLQEQSGEQSEGLFDSYETIMQSILKELQIVGKARAKNSDPLLVELEDGTYAVLDALKDTMNHVQFINSLVRSLSYKEMTDGMKRKSLQLISHVVTTDLSSVDTKDVAVHKCVLDTVGTLVLVVQDASSQTDICRQMALETLNAFIQRFGAHYSDVFLQAIPPTVDLSACEADLPGVRGMALICIASFVNTMKDAVIPMVPRIIKAVVASMKGSMEGGSTSGDRDRDHPDHPDHPEASEAEHAAALTAVKALSEHLAAFLAPNLPDILGILLHTKFCASSAANNADSVHALAEGCRSTIATAVPTRLLIGPLSSMLNEMTSGDATSPCPSSRSTLELMNMLAAVISNMDSTAVATYSGAVFSMVLKALDARRRDSSSTSSPLPSPASSTDSSIESAAVNCMLQLVLKLNETKFKPLFYRLVEWATRPPPGDTASSLPRKIAFFNVINTLTENLKSVFTTYFSALVELFLDALLYKAEDEANEADVAAVNTLQLMAMRSLTRCFMYDTSEFLDETTFNKLLGPLVALMTTTPPNPSKPSKRSAAAAAGLSPAPRGIDIDALIDNTVAASCPAWMRAELSPRATTIIACLSQMAMASGMNNGESRWRPLHHAVLMATRSNHADSRCTALETLMAICHTLQEEYLVLVPEALPFLSELLEDEDGRVERRAVEALNVLSDKSGEDLQQYLKS